MRSLAFTASEWAKIRVICRRYLRRPITREERNEIASVVARGLGGSQRLDSRLTQAVIDACWPGEQEHTT